MLKLIVALISGVLFGIGLAISGMTQPHKVVGFLDIFGSWDPSLVFVVVGAICVHSLAYIFIKKETKTLLGEKISLPTSKKIDKKLVVGSALFGIGWGLAGYCPGPALTSLATFSPAILVFLFFMALGMVLVKKY